MNALNGISFAKSGVRAILLSFLASCVTTGGAGHIEGKDIQFNIAEASGRKVTSAMELPYQDLYMNAAAAYYWTLDDGRGFVRIGYWEEDRPVELLELESDSPEFRKVFEKSISEVIKKKWTVKKAAHKNGATGLIAFGEGHNYERCAVGTAVLKLSNDQNTDLFDTLVEAAVCSNGILTPNTMDNLIWYLKKEP